MLKNKVVTVEEAISHIASGMTVAVGGFVNQGVPLTLIRALRETGVDNLTVYANDSGFDEDGLCELILCGKVRRFVCSYIGFTPLVNKAIRAGEVELVLTPQGTLLEKLRCGGAGLGGFLTPTGVGTAAMEGSEVVSIRERQYLLQEAVHVDVALVRAHVGDTFGNLRYRRSARNFNPVVATCADYVIAEVEHLVSIGDTDPESTQTPGIYIDAVVRSELSHYSRRPDWARRGADGAAAKNDARAAIAMRAAHELCDGQVANLGAGIPMMITSFVPVGIQAVIHTENGILAAGPAPEPGCEDPDCGTAGGLPATILTGGSYVDSVTSFSLIRGGHVDVTFLGAMQVDQDGNIASYEIPGTRTVGMGGAMDLVSGAKAVYVLTEHCTKDGWPKLLRTCTYPLTGTGRCDAVITERALFRRAPTGGFILEEVAAGFSLEDIRSCTEMDYVVSGTVRMGAYS